MLKVLSQSLSISESYDSFELNIKTRICLVGFLEKESKIRSCPALAMSVELGWSLAK